MMKDLRMYIQMLNLSPQADHSGALHASPHADSAPLQHEYSPATSPTHSPATVSSHPTPRTSSPRRVPRGGMSASVIGAKMARRELELSLAAAQLAPPVQRLCPAAPDERPPQPAAAMPSTLPHGLAHELENTQDSTMAEFGMHAHPANPRGAGSGSGQPPPGPVVALQEYADVADLPFIPTTAAKRSNPATVSDSDGASSLAPPGTSRAVMEIREAASRVLSTQQAAAASLAAGRDARDGFSVAASTPEGSTHGPCAPLSRNAPGTLGDGDSAPCLCSSPRGAEQLFLHKSPSHAVAGGAGAVAKASPDALAAARQSYAIDPAGGAAAVPRRPGTATAAPASGTSAGTAASAATAPADLAAAAAALQPPPPRNGLQPQPVSRPTPGSISPPILYGKLPGPLSGAPGSPVAHQSSAASASTSVSSGHKLPAYRLRSQAPPAPASPARVPGSRASSHQYALEDVSNKFAAASVSGSAMSGTAMSATGAMAGFNSDGKAGLARPRVPPPPAPGCSLSAIFCRGSAPRD